MADVFGLPLRAAHNAAGTRFVPPIRPHFLRASFKVEGRLFPLAG
jgi:hypothetical protein